MFKASELVAFCNSMVGQPYWYGTCVYQCTQSVLDSKTKQYPSHYTSSRMSTYKAAIAARKVCMDCVGMIKGFFWTNGGTGVVDYIKGGAAFKNSYATNGCPDKSADGMLSWCKSKGAKYGSISTLPDVPGILLFSSGHVGVYVGGGYAVEARGFNYGVVKTKVASRSWTSWAYMPDSLLQYDTAGGASTPTQPSTPSTTPSTSGSTGSTSTSTKTYKLGDRIIKKGVAGDDVAELQAALVKLGYNLGTYGKNKDGVDGDCGTKTVQAIKDFQSAHGLSVDGQYGPKSHAKMQEVLSSASGNSGSSGSTTDTANQCGSYHIRVTGGTVNVRNKPNTTTGKIMYVVKKDAVLVATGTDSATGWYHLSDGNYISNKYAEVVK